MPALRRQALSADALAGIGPAAAAPLLLPPALAPGQALAAGGAPAPQLLLPSGLDIVLDCALRYRCVTKRLALPAPEPFSHALHHPYARHIHSPLPPTHTCPADCSHIPHTLPAVLPLPSAVPRPLTSCSVCTLPALSVTHGRQTCSCSSSPTFCLPRLHRRS